MKNKYVEDAVKCLSILNANGFEAYFVGGFVRDFAAKSPFNDIDITTNADPETVLKLFSNLNFNVVPTGIKHGTVTVYINKNNFDITTFRSESKYSDFRHPDEVNFVKSLIEDLSRRDFTINAMALDKDFNIIDPFNGQEDLKNKIIRTVGNPNERFLEDPLRMLRAVRFKAKLGFNIDEETKLSIKNLASYINKISKERIVDELNKILIYNPLDINTLYDLNLLKYILPQSEAMNDTFQNCPFHMDTVFEHVLKCIKNSELVMNDLGIENSNKLYLELAILLHDMAKPEVIIHSDSGDHFYGHEIRSSILAESWMTSMKYSNKEIDLVTKLIKWHDLDLSKVNNPLNQIINRCKFSFDEFKLFCALKLCDIKGQIDLDNRYEKTLILFKNLISKYLEKLSQKEALNINDLALSGYDIMNLLHINPGKEIKDIKEKLYEIVFNDPSKNNKDFLSNYLLENFKKLYNN